MSLHPDADITVELLDNEHAWVESIKLPREFTWTDGTTQQLLWSGRRRVWISLKTIEVGDLASWANFVPLQVQKSLRFH